MSDEIEIPLTDEETRSGLPNAADVVRLPSAAVMEDVHNVAGRIETAFAEKSPYRANAFVPGQVETIELAVGVDLDQELGFPCHSIIVDNPTKQWLFVSSAQRWVPPGCLGMVMQSPKAASKAQARWRAPAGVAQPASAGGGTFATATFCEAFLMPDGGLLITVYPLPAIV